MPGPAKDHDAGDPSNEKLKLLDEPEAAGRSDRKKPRGALTSQGLRP